MHGPKELGGWAGNTSPCSLTSIHRGHGNKIWASWPTESIPRIFDLTANVHRVKRQNRVRKDLRSLPPIGSATAMSR